MKEIAEKFQKFGVVPVVVLSSNLPPVRYPACATLRMLSFCVPFGAELLAVTVAFVESDTLVDFKL